MFVWELANLAIINNTISKFSRRSSLSSTSPNSTTEDSNSNSSNSVERTQAVSQISLKNQKCNLLPDCDDKQEEWNLESKDDEKPQDCKNKQQDNDSRNYSIGSNNISREEEVLSLQGKIKNYQMPRGDFLP